MTEAETMTTPEDREALKPCPAASMHTIDRGEPYVGNRRSDAWFVRCATCGCCTEYYATEAEAIATWNTRAQAPAPSDVVGNLRVAIGMAMFKADMADEKAPAKIARILDAVIAALPTIAEARAGGIEEAAKVAENYPETLTETMSMPPSQFDIAAAVRDILRAKEADLTSNQPKENL